MPAAMKIIIQEFLTAQPDISVIDLATKAVADHVEKNGCEFENDAARQAVRKLGVYPSMRAIELSPDRIAELGDILEAMETNCPRKGEQTVCLS